MTINYGQGSPERPSRGAKLFITAIVMVAVAALFVLARLAVRWKSRRFGMDDYTIGAALVVSAVMSAAIDVAVVNGYGMHTKQLSHAELNACLKWFFYAQVLYKPLLGLNKASLLFLYLRIFTGKVFRWICHATLIVVVGWTVGSMFATIFQCVPVDAYWDKSIMTAKCTNSDVFWYAYAIINIITDVWILALPMPQLKKLQLPRREKVGLMMIFALGAFVCIASIIRTIAVAASTQNKKDSTWAFIPRSTWTFIESNVGIICACLPMLKHPLAILFPRLHRTTYGNTADTHRSRNNKYVPNSKRNAWARSNGDDVFLSSSTSRASAEKGAERSRGDSEEVMVDLAQLDPAHHGIIKKTDVRVSFDDDNSKSSLTPPRSMNNTEVQDHFWTSSK